MATTTNTQGKAPKDVIDYFIRRVNDERQRKKNDAAKMYPVPLQPMCPPQPNYYALAKQNKLKLLPEERIRQNVVNHCANGGCLYIQDVYQLPDQEKEMAKYNADMIVYNNTVAERNKRYNDACVLIDREAEDLIDAAIFEDVPTLHSKLKDFRAKATKTIIGKKQANG